MKKAFIFFMITMMVITSLLSSMSRATLFSQEPKKIEEIFCSIGGAVAAGAIAHNVIGKDPATFVAAIIGGMIGHDYCKNYVNNAEYQALSRVLREGIGQRPGASSVDVETRKMYAGITIFQDGQRSEAWGTSQCIDFEGSVYQKANGETRNRGNDPFLGRTSRYWACTNQSGDWEIQRNGRGIEIVRRNQGQVQSTGSVIEGDRPTRQEVQTWTRLNFDMMTTTSVMGKNIYSQEEGPLKLINRMWEPGFFAGRGQTREGQKGVKVTNGGNQPGNGYGYIAHDSQVAVECNVVLPGMQSPFCRGFQVRNVKFEGMNISGRASYIFQDQSMMVMDEVNGPQIIPMNLLVK